MVLNPYDLYDNTYEDIVIYIDGSTTIMEWASEDALDSGVTYNVYKNNVRIDDPNFVDLSNPGANKMFNAKYYRRPTN